MNSIEFFAKNAWRWKIGVPEIEQEYMNKDGSVPDIEEIKKLSFGNDFVNLMDNRMVMGFFRYGNRHNRKIPLDNIASVIRRIKLYQETGNTELLLDAANMLRMEFDIPQHPNAHFHAQDDGEHFNFNNQK